MREILFRGKRVDNGEWVEGFYACILDTHYIITGRFDSLTNGIINSEAYKVDPSTVGQFTGLTDRNGVKIFEGDIVKYGQCGKVEYNSGSAQFTLNFANSTYRGMSKHTYADRTLKSWTKAELFHQIRILERNLAVKQELVNNQAKLLETWAPVVRCKDCEHWGTRKADGYGFCCIWETSVKENSFCSSGVKEDAK